MPSSGPSTSPHTRNHRRSHSLSNEKGLGASVSLGALPKLQRKAASKKLPALYVKDSHQDEDDLHQRFAPLSIETHNLSTLHEGRFLANSQFDRPYDKLTAPAAIVPFPKSSLLSCSPEDTPLLTASTSPGYPTLSCVSSRPILLSNGTRLKSSLKSMRSTHLRAKSAPATPLNVHFPERKEDGLESVRIFSFKAKPASCEGGDGTETETETNSRFPFPRFGTNSSGPGPFPLAFVVDYETTGATSTIPVPNPPPYANIYFESAAFVQPKAPSYPLAPTAPHLTGTILVRNVAYEKHVAVRFTLDEWQTTSEVAARYVVSVPVLPWEKTRSRTPGNAVRMTENARNPSPTPLTWDRFSFDVRLDCKLQECVLWFVGRYTATGEGGGEWWDNNSGLNFRIGFKAAAVESGDRTGQTANAPGRYLSSPQPTSPANRHALTQTFNHPSYSPNQTRSIPPPLSSLALQRQAKLSLSNYAAPCLSPTSAGPPPYSLLNSPLSNPDAPKSEARATPPPSPKDEHGHKQIFPFAMQTIIGSQPATSPFFEPRFKDTTAQYPSVGSNSNSDSPSGLGYSSESNSSQLCHSPRTMTSPSATLLNSKSGSSPQSRSGTSSPKWSLDTDSNQLYNALMKQWCFAKSD
jgi:hypothetical protein